MNDNFIAGFVKAAKAVGMSDKEIENLLKQGNEQMPIPPEAAGEAQEMPLPEGAMPADPAALAEGGDQEAELDALISQLSPEEIEQLIAELTAQEQGGGEGMEEEAQQVPELAAAIEQQLGNNPEVAEATAPTPELSEEALAKQSAINFIKSAEYVEGFLEQALSRGIGLKEAVDLYDTAFTTTFNQLKVADLKGDQHKLDVDADGKIEGEDLKKLRSNKEEKATEEPDEKTAAYYEGVIERCREYGMTDSQALEFVKAAKLSDYIPKMRPKPRGYWRSGASPANPPKPKGGGASFEQTASSRQKKQVTSVEAHNNKVKENWAAVGKNIKEKAPIAVGATAGGLVGGAILGSGALSSKKDENEKAKE